MHGMGSMHGRLHVWWEGMCDGGSVHGRGDMHGGGVCGRGGACIAEGGMCGRGHAWQGDMCG